MIIEQGFQPSCSELCLRFYHEDSKLMKEFLRTKLIGGDSYEDGLGGRILSDGSILVRSTEQDRLANVANSLSDSKKFSEIKIYYDPILKTDCNCGYEDGYEVWPGYVDKTGEGDWEPKNKEELAIVKEVKPEWQPG